MRVLAVVQARTGSTRLPGKVLLPLAGAPALQRMLERVASAATIDDVVVATTSRRRDGPVAALVGALGLSVVRGSESDVLGRFALAVRSSSVGLPSHVVRLTGDCPLMDPSMIDAVVTLAGESDASYVSNVVPPTWPDGMDVEVMKTEVLLAAARSATTAADREHVTPWIRRALPLSEQAQCASPEDLSSSRWTLDEPEDYVLIASVYAALYQTSEHFRIADIRAYLASRPEISRINSRFTRNAGSCPA